MIREERDGAGRASPTAHEAVRYVAIGDSIPRGFQLGWPRTSRRDACDIRLARVPLRWFDNPNQGYPAYAAAQLRTLLGRPVELDMTFTCSGVATTHFWRADAPTTLLRSALDHPPQLVTLTLGANDLLHLWARYLIVASLTRPLRRVGVERLGARLVERFAPPLSDVEHAAAGVQHRLSRIVGWIQEQSPTTSVIVTSYYSGDAFPSTRHGFAEPLLKAARHATDASESATLVDLDTLFGDSADRAAQTGLDGLHPSPAMQQRIGCLVAAAALPQLAGVTCAGAVERGSAVPSSLVPGEMHIE